MQKATYSSGWKAGKPTAPGTGISHAFKVLKIESYEDAVNNLELRRTDAQGTLLDGFNAEARDDYMMRYMLDVEARGSLLSVKDFQKPFDYSLRIAVDSAGAWEDRNVEIGCGSGSQRHRGHRCRCFSMAGAGVGAGALCW